MKISSLKAAGFVLLGFGLSFATALWAEKAGQISAPQLEVGAPKAASGLSFGVLDMQRVILNVAEGQSARKKLEEEIRAKEKEFLEKKKELDQLNQEWQNQSSLLTEEAKLRKQQDFQKKFVELRNAEGKFQADIKQRENEETQKIAMKAAKIAEQFAKEKDLFGVFEANSSGLIYLKNPVDLTASVVAEYDKQNKGAVSEAQKSKKAKAG